MIIVFESNIFLVICNLFTAILLENSNLFLKYTIQKHLKHVLSYINIENRCLMYNYKYFLDT